MTHFYHNNIIQITIAAPNWFAVFNRAGRLEKIPVVAWGVKDIKPNGDYARELNEDDYTTYNNYTEIVGLTLDTGLDANHKYITCSANLLEVGDALAKECFLGYDYPGCGADWEQALVDNIQKKRLKELKEKADIVKSKLEIDKLGLEVRERHLLARRGITTIDQLLNLDYSQLKTLKFVGDKTIKNIAKVIKGTTYSESLPYDHWVKKIT
jgi:hypothetical protein